MIDPQATRRQVGRCLLALHRHLAAGLPRTDDEGLEPTLDVTLACLDQLSCAMRDLRSALVAARTSDDDCPEARTVRP